MLFSPRLRNISILVAVTIAAEHLYVVAVRVLQDG